MTDPIDEILEDVRCPGGNDCDCPYFYCVGFIRAAVEAGIKAGECKLAREIIDDLVLVQERVRNSLVLQVITKLREIAEEEA